MAMWRCTGFGAQVLLRNLCLRDATPGVGAPDALHARASVGTSAPTLQRYRDACARRSPRVPTVRALTRGSFNSELSHRGS